MRPYYTIADIKHANMAAGYHFFSPDTMRFFDSRVESSVYGGCLFITSEQFHGSDGYSAPRKYTIRRIDDKGDINTVGDFNQIDSLEEARQIARLLAREIEEQPEEEGEEANG